jgi:hypothetical protein
VVFRQSTIHLQSQIKSLGNSYAVNLKPYRLGTLTGNGHENSAAAPPKLAKLQVSGLYASVNPDADKQVVVNPRFYRHSYNYLGTNT